jgi:hypothetical protein
MKRIRFGLFSILGLLLGALSNPSWSQESTARVVADLPIEVSPSDPKLAKIVLIAGSNYFKPGEHEYVAGCAVLADLLKQSPGVCSVLALDWPKKPETLTGAKSIVCLFDGGDKHALLAADRMAQLRKLADEGVGLVGLHQFVDVPKAVGDRMRDLMGAAWEKGHSQRAHWVTRFGTFADHAVSRGVTPFEIDDGWLFKLRFVPEMRGVTPLLRTVSPKAANQELTDETIVAWLYERPNGGRSFNFTGTHLHASLAEEGYRRFLVNGILWTAGLEVPKTGAPVSLTAEAMNKYLKPAPAAVKK